MDFLVWLGADQARYLAVSQGALAIFLAVVLVAAFVPSLDARLSTRGGVAAYLALAFGVLLAGRWPYFFVPHMLQQDEAQAVAQAITVPYSPVPWLGFDPQTAGPLNTYLLTLPSLFGAHATFFSAHVTAVLLEFGAIAALYWAVATCFDARIARLAVLPPLVFWADSLQQEFVHYTSEHLAIFLGSVMVACVCRAAKSGFPPVLTFAIGFLAGMLPFAKLQSVPLDSAIVAVAVAALFANPGLALRARRNRLGVLALGIVSFPFLIVEVVAFGGAFADFRHSYIETSLSYILFSPPPLGFFTSMPEIGALFDWLAALTIVGGAIVALRYARLEPGLRNAFIGAAVILVAAIDAIASPHRNTPHYLLFGVIPAAAAAAASLAVIASLVARDASAGLRCGLLALGFVAIALTAQHAFWRTGYGWIRADMANYVANRPEDVMAADISARLKTGQRLAIWGYRPSYWVDTDTVMGTRDPTTFYQWGATFNPNQPYYRKRYVFDFTENRPEGFLDAGVVSFDLAGGSRSGMESFPELESIVNRDYVLADSWGRMRLFLRRDLARTDRPG